MIEFQLDAPFLILVFSILAVACFFLKAGLRRIKIPPLVGFLLLGFLVKSIDQNQEILGEQGEHLLEFLSKLGVMALLFRVGLESNLKELLKQLPTASPLWLSNMAISGGLGFAACFWLLSLGLLPSLIIGVAMMATSVGIPVKVWQDAGALKTREGEVFLDVAELDDISSVIAMAVVFALIPVLASDATQITFGHVAEPMGILLLKLAGYGLLCYLFSRFIERRLRGFIQRAAAKEDRMLILIGIGFAVAALAELIGFSVAIGAFFAGLVFSQDPDYIKIEAAFDPLYELFTPFFFLFIGFQFTLESVGGAFALGIPLFAAAVAGKFLGMFGPSIPKMGLKGATFLGIGMIPRAEITLLIMERAYSGGEGPVSKKVFSSMVLVAALTCIFAPLALRCLFERWPLEKQKENSAS